MATDDTEDAARLAFEHNRNSMGYGDPSWDELAEETRQVWRDYVATVNVTGSVGELTVRKRSDNGGR